MFGLCLQSHMTAGQDGFRDACSKQIIDLQWPLIQPECHAFRIDRSHHLFVLLQVPASPRHGRVIYAPRAGMNSMPRSLMQARRIGICRAGPSSSFSRRCARPCWPRLRRQAWVVCALATPRARKTHYCLAPSVPAAGEQSHPVPMYFAKPRRPRG